jgi:hypothetical protein
LLWPGFQMAIGGTAVTWSDILQPVLRPVLLTPLAFLASWFVSHAVAGPAIVPLLAGGLAGVAVVALATLLPGYRADVRQMLDFVKTVRKPKVAS